MIKLDICLSDLPKDKIKQGDNGKKYIQLVCNERKEKDKYGNTHTISVSRTKEERERKTDIVYVGSGQEIIFTGGVNDMKQAGKTDDLPF